MMSLFAQGRDLVGYGRTPPRVVWPDGARVAISLIVAYEEGSERSRAAGDDLGEEETELGWARDSAYRDFTTESVYGYGSRAGVWRVARLLDEYALKATFLGCAVAYELNPAVATYVREAGHEPACHGWRWETVYDLPRDVEREHLHTAVASIEHTCGDRPRGWYSRTLRSQHTRELLVEEGGFLYDSDAFDDDLPYFVTVKGTEHLIIPYTMMYNDSRFLPNYGIGDPTAFFETCRRGFDELVREGATHPKMMSIGLHPRLIGHPARLSALRQFVEHALASSDVWFARRIDIARWWLEHHHEFD
jgi:peptidoglycan/xylan/chitin deacetylase (PgdA/CDA1 family)